MSSAGPGSVSAGIDQHDLRLPIGGDGRRVRGIAYTAYGESGGFDRCAQFPGIGRVRHDEHACGSVAG